MQQQVMVKEHMQKPDQTCPAKVGSEAKNHLPTNSHGIRAIDMMGLSWAIRENEMVV